MGFYFLLLPQMSFVSWSWYVFFYRASSSQFSALTSILFRFQLVETEWGRDTEADTTTYTATWKYNECLQFCCCCCCGMCFFLPCARWNDMQCAMCNVDSERNQRVALMWFSHVCVCVFNEASASSLFICSLALICSIPIVYHCLCLLL